MLFYEIYVVSEVSYVFINVLWGRAQTKILIIH